MILWDGSDDAFLEISAWVGTSSETGPIFRLHEDGVTGQIYDTEHHSWVNVSIGQRVVKGSVGEHYPISPEVLAKTYTLAQPWQLVEAVCQGCGKRPHELFAYIAPAVVEGMTPAEWGYREEGTYNRRNGHFLCDGCYIQAGMPTSPHGWTCP